MKRSVLFIFVTRLSLICYLVVASMAAAHAFPMTNLGNQQNDQAMLMNEPSCHQNMGAASSTVCEIFCAAVGNVIPSVLNQVPTTFFLTEEIAYLSASLLNRDPELEPHPPK